MHSLIFAVPPFLRFFQQPRGKRIDALAGARGYRKYLCVRVPAQDIAAALFKVKIEIRHDVYLVDYHCITYRKHQRVFQRLIVSLRNGQYHRVLHGARIELGWTNKIADIFKYRKVDIIRAKSGESLTRHVRIKMAHTAGMQLYHLRAGAFDGARVDIGVDIRLHYADPKLILQPRYDRHKRSRLAGAGRRHQIQQKSSVAPKLLAQEFRVGIVILKNALLYFEHLEATHGNTSLFKNSGAAADHALVGIRQIQLIDHVRYSLCGLEAELRLVADDDERIGIAARAAREMLKPRVKVDDNEVIHMRLNCEVDEQFIRDLAPDAIILATGSLVAKPPIPGIDNEKFLTVADILDGKVLPGRNVLIAGGGLTGCETADFLCEHNRVVSVMEMAPVIAADAEATPRRFLMQRLNKWSHALDFYGPALSVYTGAKIKQFYEDGVAYEMGGEVKELHGFDSIILSLGVKSYNPLEEVAKSLCGEVYVVGDAEAAGNANHATDTGLAAALKL